MCEVASRSREPRAMIACLFLRATFFDVFNVLRFLDIYKFFFPPLDRALAYLLLKTYLAMIIKMIGSIEACTVFTRSIFTRDLLDIIFFLRQETNEERWFSQTLVLVNNRDSMQQWIIRKLRDPVWLAPSASTRSLGGKYFMYPYLGTSPRWLRKWKKLLLFGKKPHFGDKNFT